MTLENTIFFPSKIKYLRHIFYFIQRKNINSLALCEYFHCFCFFNFPSYLSYLPFLAPCFSCSVWWPSSLREFLLSPKAGCLKKKFEKGWGGGFLPGVLTQRNPLFRYRPRASVFSSSVPKDGCLFY